MPQRGTLVICVALGSVLLYLIQQLEKQRQKLELQGHQLHVYRTMIRRYSVELNEAESKAQCVICYEQKANIIFVPCGHKCCLSCAEKLVRCHMCRGVANPVRLWDN